MAAKRNQARANIRATLKGGLRSGVRKVDPAPVTIIYGGGSSLPAPETVQHPEPQDAPAKPAKRCRSRTAKPLRVMQDGAQFYHFDGGGLIAEYPILVDNDYDMVGATTARVEFMRAYPDAVFPDEDDGLHESTMSHRMHAARHR